MEYQSVERAPEDFQQPVSPNLIEAMCRRAFGDDVTVLSAVELGGGMYNTTYRVDLEQHGPFILRIAPEQARQYRSERGLMRNEHASVPYLAPIAALMPRTVAADFTHDLVDRDYLFQTELPGLPAPEGLAGYPRPRWRSFFAQLGTIARAIHSVRGPRFGPVAGPGFGSWSEAVLAGFEEAAADLGDAGLDAKDVLEVAALADRDRAVFDEIAEPRLLHGDLWTINLMVSPDAPEPTITGVFDGDRTSFGDPEADWVIFMATRRPGTERDSFWETWGPLGDSAQARRRRLFYQARHTAAIRLEAHRLNQPDDAATTYEDMRRLLAELGAQGLEP
ncbi:phosphotransferase family protein [Kitasatospora sp. NBC_01266]|uniref:phosphotransferase family protein n=1 Tax=Kitasatospora sp. NBC_01266 TaxID=2903572 RepID=UPI002E367934|nr:aminoglycoside phosphotransferase family protein [Kitasatospora sp. NBC_01266]